MFSIQGQTGYVDSIRLLYIKLYETSGLDSGQSTRKIIKIPNSLIITQPIVLVPIETSPFIVASYYLCVYQTQIIWRLPIRRVNLLQELDQTYKMTRFIQEKTCCEK